MVNDHADVARGHSGMENHDVNMQGKDINAINDMLMHWLIRMLWMIKHQCHDNLNEDCWIQHALKEPLSDGALMS